LQNNAAVVREDANPTREAGNLDRIQGDGNSCYQLHLSRRSPGGGGTLNFAAPRSDVSSYYDTGFARVNASADFATGGRL